MYSLVFNRITQYIFSTFDFKCKFVLNLAQTNHTTLDQKSVYFCVCSLVTP